MKVRPDALAGLSHPHRLAGEGVAEVHLPSLETDPAAVSLNARSKTASAKVAWVVDKAAGEQKQPVGSGEPHAGACPFQDLELMSQRENFKLQGCPIRGATRAGHEQRDDDGSHRRTPLAEADKIKFLGRTKLLVGTPPSSRRTSVPLSPTRCTRHRPLRRFTRASVRPPARRLPCRPY